jgi:hypothetical protein
VAAVIGAKSHRHLLFIRLDGCALAPTLRHTICVADGPSLKPLYNADGLGVTCYMDIRQLEKLKLNIDFLLCL